MFYISNTVVQHLTVMLELLTAVVALINLTHTTKETYEIYAALRTAWHGFHTSNGNLGTLALQPDMAHVLHIYVWLVQACPNPHESDGYNEDDTIFAWSYTCTWQPQLWIAL